MTLASIPDSLLLGTCNEATQKRHIKEMTDDSRQLYNIFMSLKSKESLIKADSPATLILDDLDGMSMKLSSILTQVKTLSCPTILICNDRYDTKLKSIGSKTLHVPFYSVPTSEIEGLLKAIDHPL